MLICKIIKKYLYKFKLLINLRIYYFAKILDLYKFVIIYQNFKEDR